MQKNEILLKRGMNSMIAKVATKWRNLAALLVCLVIIGCAGPDRTASVANAAVEPLAAVRIDGKFGYIDKSGELVIPAKYNRAWKFSEGLGKVLLNNKFGFIDKDGSFVIMPQFDMAWDFIDVLAQVKIDGKFGFIDKTGILVRR